MTTSLSDGIDCHIHLFGNPLRYPCVAAKTYTPDDATWTQWRATSEPFGVNRAVLVQPSVYGTDNTRLLEGLREAGSMARGVAVIDEHTPDAVLASMQALGVRGVRLNLATGAVPNLVDAARQLLETAARIKDFGWHLQLLARGALLEKVVELIPKLPVAVVLDHMAGAHVGAGPDEKAWSTALGLLRDANCWIKISGADHVSARRDEPEQALPTMQALVRANPRRLIWGSDWPHIGKAGGPNTVTYLPIDHGRLLALLRKASGDAFDGILTRNAEQLYGWDKA